MTKHGIAMRMKIELAALVAKHGLTRRAFTPAPLRPPSEQHFSLQGYASPATVDRDHMKFAPRCWEQFKPGIPLLYRHQQNHQAGEILELDARNDGLFVRAWVTDSEAKCCGYFSIAASVHDYKLIDDGPRTHALITSATLDEVSLVLDPTHDLALAEPTPPPVEFFVLAGRAIGLMVKQLDIIGQLASQPAAPMPLAPISPARGQPHLDPHRQTSFGSLINAIEANHAH